MQFDRIVTTTLHHRFPAQLIGALESKVKHAQCFDVALMRDGSIVLASKDYRLYIYRYVKVKNCFYSRIINEKYHELSFQVPGVAM